MALSFLRLPIFIPRIKVHTRFYPSMCGNSGLCFSFQCLNPVHPALPLLCTSPAVSVPGAFGGIPPRIAAPSPPIHTHPSERPGDGVTSWVKPLWHTQVLGWSIRRTHTSCAPRAVVTLYLVVYLPLPQLSCELLLMSSVWGEAGTEKVFNGHLMKVLNLLTSNSPSSVVCIFSKRPF